MDKSDLLNTMEKRGNAARLPEPEEMLSGFFSAFAVEKSEQEVTVRIPHFFGSEDGELKLTFYEFENTYYVHDNGCTAAQLKRNATNNFETLVKKMCHPTCINNGRIFGRFPKITDPCPQTHIFYHYIHSLILISNADLICERIKSPVFGINEAGDIENAISGMETIDTGALFTILKSGFRTWYKENTGLYFRPGGMYSNSNTGRFFLFHPLSNGRVRLSDGKKGDFEGDMLANFLCNPKPLSDFMDFLNPLLKRFDVDFDGEEDLWLTTDITDGDFVSPLLRFFNFAVLISEFNYRISLYKA